MLKALLISQVIFTCQAAWYDSLDNGSIEGYLNQTEIKDFIIGLDSSNAFTAKESSKKTVNGHKVPMFYRKSSKSNGYGLLITAGHTTSQPLSVTMSLYLIGSILKSKDYSWKLIEEFFDLYIVPTVNVDRFIELESDNKVQRYLKNVNGSCETNPGVDLARNFDFKFDVKQNDVCSDEYQGTQGFSEVETQILRNLINEIGNVSCWIHLDGGNDSFVIPWGYDSDENEFGSEFLDDSYAEVENKLAGNYTVGNLDKVYGVEYGGSLVDYGASKGIFTIQGSFESTIPSSSQILNKCQSHLESLHTILKQTLLPLSIIYLSSSISSQTSDNETLYTVSLNFNITNPSKSHLDALIHINYSNLDSNFTITPSASSRHLSGSDSSEHLFSIQGYSSLLKTVTLTISGKSSSPSFDISFQVLLQDYDSNPEYSILASSIYGDKVPKDSQGSVFWRSWYRSSSHHEGVAIGLISAIFVAFFALFILFLLKKYKESDGLEANDEEIVSGYSIKEFSIDGSHSNLSENSFSQINKPVDSRFVNSSVAINVPMHGEKHEIKVEVRPKEPNIQGSFSSDSGSKGKKPAIPEKPVQVQYNYKPPSGSGSPKHLEMPKKSSAVPFDLPKISRDSPRVVKNVFPSVNPVEKTKVNVGFKEGSKKSSKSSSDSIEIIHDDVVAVDKPPQFGMGINAGVGVKEVAFDVNKSGPGSFGNLDGGQVKVEEHLTFNSNSSSSSSSSRSSKSDS